jgi:UDP-glucose 4-epimerase
MHVCIIGGSGFIGSHIVGLLNARGERVSVVGREAAPTRPLPTSVAYRAGDYGDAYFLRGVLQDVDTVVCLAHTTVPKTSFDDPVSDLFGNLPAAIKLYQTAAALPIKRLLFVSSGGTVYGPTTRLPLDEDAPTRPISPYGISKLAMEQYGFMYHVNQGLPIICVRPANAYGPGQIPFSGQGFVATAMASLLTKKELVLFGENGTIRDYVHVRDMAAGIIAALDQGAIGATYNLGSGQGRTTREVLDAILALSRADGYDVPLRVLPERRFDVPANVLDAARLQRDTGWRAQIPFDEGLRETWHWYRDRRAAVSGP